MVGSQLCVHPEVDLEDPPRIVVLNLLIRRLEQPRIGVALDDVAPECGDRFDRFQGLRALGRDVAKTDDPVGAAPAGIGEDGLGR